MSHPEHTNNPRRRYRVEVKRAKKVKKPVPEADEGRPLSKADDAVDTQPDSAAYVTPQEPDASAARGSESLSQPEPETVQGTTEADAGGETAENGSAGEEIELAADTDDGEYVDRTVVLPNEEFDYVIPKETFKQHYSRKHVSSEHTGTTKTASKEEQEEADAGYIFSSRRHRKHRRRRHHHRHHKFKHLPLWKRILIITVAVILALALTFTGTFLILREIGRHNMHNYDGFEVSTPDRDEDGNGIVKVDKSGRVITYNGVTYELNEDIINVSFIGVDEGSGENDNEKLQMADAIYIMALDVKTGETKILGISRDTMADVDLYSEQGKFIDTERMQMAFSYAYGNDKVTGGKNTTKSLSRLFYGLPLNNYFAINMNALITLNDTIGGVTLVSSMTFTSPIDGRTISKGDTVTLHGKEADYYVRHRDTEKLDSNNERMERQQEYIRAFMKAMIPAVKKDISVVSKLYNEIKVNSDTTLNLPKMTYIASTAATKLKSASDIEYVSLKGKITEGEYAEMNVSNKDTMETMLSVFYKPLADVPDNMK